MATARWPTHQINLQMLYDSYNRNSLHLSDGNKDNRSYTLNSFNKS